MLAELIPILSPLKAAMLAAACCVISILVVLKRRRAFRGFRDLREDLGEIVKKLDRGRVDRDAEDLLISGEQKQIPFSIRLSHSETAPGLYVRCTAPVNFELTFVAAAGQSAEGNDVYRTGDATFDRRFLGRTDNRVRARMFLSQPGCEEQLQQLCCSNKTMLRIADDTIELSEALIPSDTARHVIAHIESMVILSQGLAGMSGRARVPQSTGRGALWGLRVAAVIAVALLVAGWFIFRDSTAMVKATVPDKSAQDNLSNHGLVIPNPDGWIAAEVADLNPDFVAWLKQSGINPATRIVMDGSADRSSNSVVHVLRPSSGEKSRRIVWMIDKSVVCDLVGPADGVTRIPQEALSRVSWAEGSAPTFTPDGDGLLVVRDHSKPETATIYFTSHRVLHTAIPADFEAISLL